MHLPAGELVERATVVLLGQPLYPDELAQEIVPGCHGDGRRKLRAAKRGSWCRHGLDPRRTVDVTAKEVLALDDLVPHGVDWASVHPQLVYPLSPQPFYHSSGCSFLSDSRLRLACQ